MINNGGRTRYRFAELAHVEEQVIDRAQAWYTETHLPEPLATAPRPALSRAMQLAGGEPRKITVEEDGSLIVWNRPRW